MSAAATATVVDAAPPKKGKKKLIVILAAALLVLVAGGGATVFVLKKKAAQAAEAEEAEDAGPARASAAADPKATPTFVPLDPFTVNLADRDAERYAQVGITLEIDDAKIGDRIKLFMPAIRNNILMTIADKTAAQLMDREGKLRLALEVRRETARALGYEVASATPPSAPLDAEKVDAKAKADAKADTKGDPKPGADEPGKTARPAAKPAPAKDPDSQLPIKAVHFSNFIIQ